MLTWVIAIAGVAEATAVVIAVLYAKGQLVELRKSREETTRPFVVVDFDISQTMIFLKVRNMGQSIAKNVTFRFSPSLESTWEDKNSDFTPSGKYRVEELDIFANGIPSLAPGKEHSTILDQTLTRIPAKLQTRYDVDVSFDAPNGKRYTDRQTISLDTYLGLVRVESKGVHEIAKALEDITREVKRWGASGSGLRIVTEEDMRQRYQRFLEMQDQVPDPDNSDETDEDEAEDEAA